VIEKNDSALGIDIGSTSVKACLLNGKAEAWSEVRAHDGDVAGTVRAMLGGRKVGAGVPALVTGGEGRRQFQLASAIATEALERALEALRLDVSAVVSVGGEDLVVYRVDDGRIVGTYAGNKCASGTGEFFAQQLRRMDLPLDAVHLPQVGDGTVHRLSSRCSVFMKSDCTHKLNKGEADKHDIVLSLSHVMAGKVLEFLAKARITSGRVVLAAAARVTRTSSRRSGRDCRRWSSSSPARPPTSRPTARPSSPARRACRSPTSGSSSPTATSATPAAGRSPRRRSA